MDEETGLYYYGARYYDPKTSVWQSVEPKLHKYPEWSPYAFTLNNPISYVDPDGTDVYLIIYATTEGDVGHAALAVENHNQDGIYTFYELGPDEPIGGLLGAFKKVKPYYKKKDVTEEEAINDPISEYEDSSPHGVIKFETSEKTDKEIHKEMSERDKKYDAVGYNCTDYASCGAEMAAEDVNIKSKESIILPIIRVATPNRLFRSARRASNASLIRVPGRQAEKGFGEAYKKSPNPKKSPPAYWDTRPPTEKEKGQGRI